MIFTGNNEDNNHEINDFVNQNEIFNSYLRLDEFSTETNFREEIDNDESFQEKLEKLRKNFKRDEERGVFDGKSRKKLELTIHDDPSLKTYRNRMKFGKYSINHKDRDVIVNYLLKKKKRPPSKTHLNTSECPETERKKSVGKESPITVGKQVSMKEKDAEKPPSSSGTTIYIHPCSGCYQDCIGTMMDTKSEPVSPQGNFYPTTSMDPKIEEKKGNYSADLDADSFLYYRRRQKKHEGIPHKICKCHDYETIPKKSQEKIHENERITKQKKMQSTKRQTVPMPRENPKIHKKTNEIEDFSQKTTVECQTEHSNMKTIDIGRNITIQIIPNSNQSVPNHSPKLSVEIVGKNVDYARKTTLNDYKNDGNNARNPESIVSEQRQCWWACSWRRKKEEDPYYSRKRKKQNKGTDTDQNVQSEPETHPEVKAAPLNFEMLYAIENSGNREHFLKSLSRLNRGLIRDLFATPSPSFVKGCSRGCVHKVRGPPYPMCEGDALFLKPSTANQFSQSEPKTMSDNSFYGKDRIFFECMRYFMDRMRSNEDCCECSDENWCCYNNCCCCCCCQMPPPCCFRSEKRKLCKEEKKVGSFVSKCSKSTEVKNVVKHVGINVCSELKVTKTVSTNTETVSKTPKPKKCCCKPRCCHHQCCRPMCCQFEHNLRYCDSMNEQQIERKFPHNDQNLSVYCCQCEHNPKCSKSSITLSDKNGSINTFDKNVGTVDDLTNGNDENIKKLMDLCKFGDYGREFSWCNKTSVEPNTKDLMISQSCTKFEEPKALQLNSATGDHVEDTVSKIQYLSGIFEAILTSREKKDSKYIQESKCLMEKLESNDEKLIENEKIKGETSKVENKKRINVKSENTMKNCQENRNKLAQLSKTTTNLSNSYSSRPFTTKTGLMSYIPPSRDSFLSFTKTNNRTTQNISKKKDIKSMKRVSTIQNRLNNSNDKKQSNCSLSKTMEEKQIKSVNHNKIEEKTDENQEKNKDEVETSKFFGISSMSLPFLITQNLKENKTFTNVSPSIPSMKFCEAPLNFAIEDQSVHRLRDFLYL